MKTPRELLLKHHRSAEPELNAIRQAALATVKKTTAKVASASLLDFLRPLRWHFAGLGAIWLLIMFLHLDTGRPTAMMAAVPPIKPASPKVIIASLRENRRQLYEMIGPNFDAEPRTFFLPKPHSDRRAETAIA
jgi:hypothetical protein